MLGEHTKSAFLEFIRRGCRMRNSAFHTKTKRGYTFRYTLSFIYLMKQIIIRRSDFPDVDDARGVLLFPDAHDVPGVLHILRAFQVIHDGKV